MKDLIRILTASNNVIFNEPDHSYKNNYGETYTSCTTLLKNYVPKFRDDYWSAYKAIQKYGLDPKSFLSSRVTHPDNIYITQYDEEKHFKNWFSILKGLDEHVEDLLNKWERDRNFGTLRGSLVHEYCLHRVNNRIIYPNDSIIDNSDRPDKLRKELKILFKHANNFAEDFINNRFIPVKEELMVSESIAMISGQIDLLAYNCHPDRKGFYIFDYKTDKEIRYTNKYGSMMTGICNSMDECEWNKYCLQVNLYRYMVEKSTGIKIQGMYIIWFNKDNENYKKLNVPNLSSIIEAIVHEQEERIRHLTDIQIQT